MTLMPRKTPCLHCGHDPAEDAALFKAALATPSEIPRSVEADDIMLQREFDGFAAVVLFKGHSAESKAKAERVVAALKAPSTNAAPQAPCQPAPEYARPEQSDSTNSQNDVAGLAKGVQLSQPAASAPSSGSVVVPRIPTDAMLLAMSLVSKFDDESELEFALEGYNAMLAAAPQPAQNADTQRLDWLQKQHDGALMWVARESSTGRGFRLHQDPHDGTHLNVREAIDDALAQNERFRS